MSIAIAHRQITTVRLIDDDASVRDGYRYSVDDLDLLSEDVEDPILDINQFVRQFDRDHDAAICDLNLKTKNYSAYNGDELVSRLYSMQIPALLCTRWSGHLPEPVRYRRRQIPVVLAPNELSASSIRDAFTVCMGEFAGEYSEPRRPWRAMIRFESGELAGVSEYRFSVVIPAWNPTIGLTFVVPRAGNDVLRTIYERLAQGEIARAFAQVNLGAEREEDVYVDGWSLSMSASPPVAGTAELVILDVGHGNAAVIHENSTSVLIDAAAGSHVLEYLRRRAITELRLVVLSHSDQDHIAGLIALLGQEYESTPFRLNADSEKGSQLWRDLIFSLEDARLAGSLAFDVGLSSGPLPVDRFRACRLEILGPTPLLAAPGAGGKDRQERKITSNSISACIRVLYAEKPVVILTGDMDQIALDELIHASAVLTAPVLVFPHHGGLAGEGEPVEFTTKLLRSVVPDTVVFSIGRHKHDNPRPEIVSAILAANARVHVACTQLSKRCSDVQMSTQLQHLSTAFSAGASKNLCCAGTIVVDLVRPGIAPEVKAAHVMFVKEFVPTPLCDPATRSTSGRSAQA